MDLIFKISTIVENLVTLETALRECLKKFGSFHKRLSNTHKFLKGVQNSPENHEFQKGALEIS